jgi:HTH-type transcriptional regulator, competence development regulator
MTEFGKHVRAKREAKRASKGKAYSLRQVAKRMGLTPGYLSKIERGEFGPPSEKVILALAKDLGEHPAVLLAMAGKVAKKLQRIICKRPKLFTELIEQLEDAPDHAVLRVVREVKDGDW